jgi:hypothetical protein
MKILNSLGVVLLLLCHLLLMVIIELCNFGLVLIGHVLDCFGVFGSQCLHSLLFIFLELVSFSF